MMPIVSRFGIVCLIAAPLLAPSVALAEPPPSRTDPAAAQALFYDARVLMQAGKFSEACPKLEESLRLDAGVGTQFNLADCNEHLGRLATAWAGFIAVASESKHANQVERERLARRRAAALEPRLPGLVIVVGGARDGLEVKRDGMVVGAATWGTRVPVDPGLHRIEASAPGKQPWEAMVQVSEATVTRVSLPVELTTPLASTSAALPSQAAHGEASLLPKPNVERGSTQRTVGWLVTGLGAASVGLAAGFALSSLGKRNESRTHCAADACDAAGVTLRDEAIRNGNIATIATLGGGAAVAGGLIIVLTSPSGPSAHERVTGLRASPTAGFGSGGLLLQGVFQ